MKHLLKKTLSLILCIAVIFSFTACGSENVYEGPWWTQLGGNSAHTGSIDTNEEGFVYPSELPKLTWEHQIDILNDTANSALVYAEGNIYFGCTDGNVYCLKDGSKRARELWKYQTEGSIAAALIYDDGVIYCCGLDGCVYALNAKNGKLIWFKDLGGTDNDGFTYSPVITDNSLIVGSDKGIIYALSLEEGKQGNVLWSYTTPNKGTVDTHLTYYDDGGDGVVYYGSYNTYYYALNARTGKFMWDFYTSTVFNDTPTAYDGNVYLPSGEGILYCLDAITGKTKWKFECEQGLYIVGPVAAYDGKIIFGSFDYNVYCLDAYDGDELWVYDDATYVAMNSPTVCGDRVYICISSIQENLFHLYCLDINNGTFKWCSASANSIIVPATIVNGSIFYTTSSGKIVKLSGAQATEK